MSEVYSPNLFLFQSFIEEVVKQGKKHIRTAPFDIELQTLFANDKSQCLDLYHAFFLAAMSHTKTREVACLNYEKLIGRELVDKERLPIGMISAVLTACANVGGSTSGSSSLGSASLNNSPQHQTQIIGALVKSILLHTYQPTHELTLGLNYLLEGTRKKNAIFYVGLLEEVYAGLLVRYRQSASSRLVSAYLSGLLDEVEGHFGEEGYRFASRQIDKVSGKIEMPVYAENGGFGKFGRCFICRKEAGHYMKDEFVPICSISCKDRVKELLLEAQAPEQFSVFGWVIDNLPTGDQIIINFLQRELQAALQLRTLTTAQLQVIFRVLATHIESPQLVKLVLAPLALIITRWTNMIPQHEVSIEKADFLENYFKVFYIEILGVVEELPVSKENLEFVSFFNEIVKHQPTFTSLFTRYDSRFYQPNILARMLNILSQYARKFETAVDGLHQIVKMLNKRYNESHQGLNNWPFAAESAKKKQLKKIITLFNKKPLKGIALFKKIFESVIVEQLRSKEQISECESPIKSYNQQALPEEVEVSHEQQDQENEEKVSDEMEENMEETISKEQEVNEENSEKIEQITTQNRQISAQQEQSRQDGQGKVEIPLPISQEEIKQTQPLKQSRHQQQQQRVRVTPMHIAIFLRQFTQSKPSHPPDNRQPITLPLISQNALGEYFGLNNDEARQVCQAYLSTFDFSGFEIDDMMRIVLNSFSLPKETQMIDRIIGDVAKRLVGLYGLKDDTESFQYFYLLLMVQTTNHNPNVRQSQRLKLEGFLKMCKSMMGRIPDKAEADYNRILDHPLNSRMKYPQDTLFQRKYLGNLEKETGQLFGQGQLGSEARYVLLYIWEYLVIGLVWPGNSKGLLESVVLLGKEGLAAEQRAFFEALRKEGPQESARDAILRLGIEFGNYLHGDLWGTVISLIYKLENENQFNSAVLDKLFTNSGRLHPLRLRDFLRALLQFSKSDIKQDSNYTRQIFVLRHINSLLEYNIPRFDELAAHMWQLLQDYFRDICLHPRREVSMAAIDSFKQLVLKLLKLHEEAVPHQALMDTFLHIFERSCLEMKDLIANVLLNIITADLRDGWDAVYQILDRLDNKDKNLVVRILGRLVGQIGLARLTNLPRLHAICIKQLRICSENEVVEQLLTKVWQLSQFINDSVIWLQTIKSILDTFKKSLNSNLLEVFIRMCNRCLAEDHAVIPDRDIFNEIVDLLMFLTDLKGSHGRVAATLLNSLDKFKEINVDLMVKYLGGTVGFLSNFQLFLSTDVRLPFAVFMRGYFLDILLPALRRPSNQLQFQQFSQWCINQYYDNLPLELINLKEKDKDFEKTLANLLKERKLTTEREETELIEFHLSHKQYKEKSTLHLIFLEIVREVYRLSEDYPKLRNKIEESVIDSFDCAFKINRHILLRNFLWKNGFLSAQHLPGLHKQEHRTLLFILKEFPFHKSYPILKNFLKHYVSTSMLLQNLRKEEKEVSKVGNGRSEGKEARNIHIYIVDAQLWLNQSYRGVCSSWEQLRWQLHAGHSDFKREELWEMANLGLEMLSLTTIPACVCSETSEALKLVYQLLL